MIGAPFSPFLVPQEDISRNRQKSRRVAENGMRTVMKRPGHASLCRASG
jgi:hypothetical protein